MCSNNNKDHIEKTVEIELGIEVWLYWGPLQPW